MSIGSWAIVIEVEKTTPEIGMRKDEGIRGKKDNISKDVRLEQMTR
jgi:hypothetical protein